MAFLSNDFEMYLRFKQVWKHSVSWGYYTASLRVRFWQPESSSPLDTNEISNKMFCFGNASNPDNHFHLMNLLPFKMKFIIREIDFCDRCCSGAVRNHAGKTESWARRVATKFDKMFFKFAPPRSFHDFCFRPFTTWKSIVCCKSLPLKI